MRQWMPLALALAIMACSDAGSEEIPEGTPALGGQQESPSQEPPSWTLTELKDEMTDEVEQMIYGFEVDREDRSAMMSWGCYEGEVSLILHTEEYLPSDKTEVMWRIDEEAARSAGSSFVGSGGGVVGPEAATLALARATEGATRLRIRAGVYDFEFAASGLYELLQQLACWPG